MAISSPVSPVDLIRCREDFTAEDTRVELYLCSYYDVGFFVLDDVEYAGLLTVDTLEVDNKY